jgi:hypothetical protein
MYLVIVTATNAKAGKTLDKTCPHPHRIRLTARVCAWSMTRGIRRTAGDRAGRLVFTRTITKAAAALPPVITAERGGLAGHTITVERVDTETARAWMGVVSDWRTLIGRRAVVERQDGRLGKVCAIAGADGVRDDEIELAAQSTAQTYGARYVPAGS